MKIVLFLMSLALAGNAFASTGVKPEAEATVVKCPAVEEVEVSVVKAKFVNSPVKLFLKVISSDGKIGPFYQELTLKQRLGYVTDIYESKDFTYTYYTFGTGKKPVIADKVNPQAAVTCEVVGE